MAPLRLLYIHAPADDALREALERQLRIIHRQDLIQPWHAGCVVPGSEVQRELQLHLCKTRDPRLIVMAGQAAYFTRPLRGRASPCRCDHVLSRSHRGCRSALPTITFHTKQAGPICPPGLFSSARPARQKPAEFGCHRQMRTKPSGGSCRSTSRGCAGNRSRERNLRALMIGPPRKSLFSDFSHFLLAQVS